ncbi:MAG: autotransporter-associated beta strand repeat-containing protein [Gemmataceae bacterium]
MKRAAWSRWLRNYLSQQPTSTARRPKARRLRLEDLEDRLAPADVRWVGGDATNLWSKPANWANQLNQPTVPSTGDNLVFPGGVAKLTSQNDIEGLEVNSIVFDGSGYTLTGNAIVLGSQTPNTGYINANPGSNTIAFDIQMGGVAGNRQFFTVGTATANAGAVLTISGKLVGTTEVELSKDGQGVLVLTADNSALNSPITITQGAIRIRHKDALGDQAHRTTVLDTAPGSAQLQIDTVTGDIGEPLRLNGDGLSKFGALLNLAGNNVYTGTIVLASNSTIGATAGALTLNGVISDETASSLTKEGAGTVILDPLNTPDGNTYRGQTFVNAGILTIHHSLALGNDPNSTQLNNTVVRSGPEKSGTLRVEYVANPARIDPYANTDPARPGFTVPFEALTLNGPGVEGIGVFPRTGNGANNITTVSGALNNASGFNTWTKDVTLWSNNSEVNGNIARWNFAGVSALVAIGVEGGSELVFEGHINDDNLTPIGATTALDHPYSLAKTRAGRAVFVNQNSYRGRTEILEGFLNIRDSQALGAATLGNAGNGTFVFTGATLELEADDIPDSQSGTPAYADPPHGLPHLPTDIIITDENLRIMGDGSANTGAIRSILGVNELTGNIQLQKVYPRGNIQFTGNGASFGVEPDRAPFLQADRSQLTVSGIIADDPDGSLASGTNRRSNLTKFGGGELVLTAANTYTGVTSIRQGWVTARNSRALGGDAGSNSGTGPVSADTQQPETYIAQGAALHLKGTRTTVQVPINLPERIFVSGNGIDHRFPELSHRGAILNLSESNTISSVVTLVGTTTRPRVGLGAELDPTDPTVTTSQLTFTNLIQEGTTNPANPNGVAAVPTAGIDKLGRKRVILQGQGTYSGDNVVAEGVLRVQTDTALGHLTGTTTVNNGAALELAPYVATLHGGVANGIQVRESLVLSGPGNVTADDDSRDYTNPKLVDTLTNVTLPNVSSDNIWNGPISLLTDVNLKAPLNSRLGLWDQIAGPGGFRKTGPGRLVLGGTNTYLGQTLVTAGTVNLQSGTALGSTAGGTIVSPDAAVELQGDITVTGEPLTLLGNGPDAATAVTPTWFSMGPGPLTNTSVAGSKTTGGRVTAVAADPFDPNVLYGAGADGGLWRTKNGGFTWEPLLNNPAGVGASASADTTFVGSVAVSPTNSRWIYVATGEANNSIDSFYGRGILRSSDYGQTWTLIQPPAPGFDRQSISKIVVDPAFEDVIYVAVQGNAANGDVATPGAGVWRFDGRPGGSGWTNLTTGQTPSGGQSTAFGATARYTDLAVINSNPWLANPNFPFEQFRRMVFIAVGDPTGTGPSSTYVWNDVGNDRLGGVGPAGPNATPTTWNNMGFDTGTEDFNGRDGMPTYLQRQKYGTVKVTATRPGGGTTITTYAAAAYPTTSDRVDQGTDSRFRTVFVGNSTYDITNNVWSVPGMGAVGAQPPSNPTGTAADSAFGEQGWYTSTISVSPNDANFVFLGGPGGPGTQDGPWVYNGTAWVDVNQAVGQGPAFNFHAAAWDSQGRLIVGNDGGIWRLEGSAPPAGTPTWTNLNGNFLQLGQTTGLDVNPTQVFSAVAGFNMNGTASWNDSLTWTQVDSGQGGTVFIDNVNSQVMYHAQDGNLRRSTDGGANWTTIVSGIVTPRINLTALIPPPVPYQVPGNLNSFPNTVLQGPPTGPSQGFPRVIDLNFPFVMDRVTPSRILYGSRQGNGTQTPQLGDGAAVWEITGADTANPTIARLNPNTSFGSNLMSFTRAIALANRQGPWQLDPTTGGPNPIPGFPLATDQGANSYDPNTIYVLSSDGGVWVTKNNGQLWLQRNTGLPANLNTLSDITVDPNNRDIAYVTVNAFGGPQVYRTTDAGRNWSPLATGLPDSPAWKVVVNPRNNDVYVGNDRGVYRLPGGNGTWVRFGNGMPQVQVRELVINNTTNTITAGTYGRGVFQAQLEDSRADGGGLRVVSGSSIWTGNVAVTGDLDIRAETGSQIDFRGTIAEDPNAANPPFTINKLGQGRVVFSGTNTYAGLTNVREGQLAVRNPFALGTPGDAAKTVVFVGAALELQSNLARETVELNGNGTLFNGHYTGALRNVSNDNVFTGKVVLNAPSQGPVNNPPLPSDPASQITIGVESGSTLTIGVDTRTANPVPGTGSIVDLGPARLLTKELTGRLILNTPNTFAGELQVNQGQLQVANSLALGDVAAGVRVRNGAQLELTRATNGSAITIANEDLVLAGTGVNDTGALRNLAGSNTWTGTIFLRGPGPNGTGDPSVISLPIPTPTVPPNKASINVVSAADTLTLSGVIREDDPNAPPPPPPAAMGLDKIGPGRLVLTRNNTYSGTTSILAGVLRAPAANALGAPGTGAAGTVVSAGAALELFTNTAGITFAAEEVTLTGKGIAPGNLGALRNVGGNNTWSGNVVLNSTVSPKTSTPNPQIAIGVDAGTQLLVSGTDLVRDAATVPATAKAAELHKVGTGTLALGGSNTFAGLTDVESGVLNIRNGASLGGLLNDVQTIDVTGLGGTFRLNFNNAAVDTGNLPASADQATIQAALEGLSTVGAGNVLVQRALNSNFIVVTFVNALGGANQPQLTGSGASGTTIAIATVQNGGPSAGTVVRSGATLQVQGGITVANEPLTLNGSGVNNAGALENASGNNTWSRSITLGSDSYIGVSGAGDTLTIDQSITQASANLGVTKVGPGTLAYAGGAGTGNTYTGTTKVNDGTLLLNKTGGAVAINGNLTVGDGVGGNATARLAQPNQVLDSATVRVESDGLFDLNGLAETIATLRILDGDANTRNGGVLTVGAIDMTGGKVSIGLGGQLVLNGNVTATSSALETATIDGLGVVNLNSTAPRDFTVLDGPRLVDLRVDSTIGGARG